MFDFMTVSEAAEKWGISARMVQIHCKTGRIDGVSRVGNSWIIPVNTEKPVDQRIKSGKYIKGKSYARRKKALPERMTDDDGRKTQKNA